MKINCPHCTKEIEFLVKSNIINQPNVNGHANVSQSQGDINQSPSTPVSQTPIISRGAPIQSHGAVYYRDNNTGQVFVQQAQSGLGNAQQAQNLQQERQITQSQLDVSSNGVSKTVQENAKTNVVNNPSAVDNEQIRGVAFGAPKPPLNTANEQKHKEAENILSRLANSDGMKR